MTLNISGIIKPKNNNEVTNIIDSFFSFTSKIGYKKELLDKVLEVNKESTIVNYQINSNDLLLINNYNLNKNDSLTYLNYNKMPNKIYIFPKSYESKKKIIKYLNSYKKGNIKYTDYTKTVSDTFYKILKIITIILIGFSSISLIVSSIMMGIITYISVLERTKEIGILRCLGARKKDISKIFLSESFIIGMLSGIIGCVNTRIILILVNSIIYKLIGIKNISNLNFNYVILLIFISILITLIGAFIPSKMAGKKELVNILKN